MVAQPLIPEFGRERQEDLYEFRRPDWSTELSRTARTVLHRETLTRKTTPPSPPKNFLTRLTSIFLHGDFVSFVKFSV